MRGSFNLDIQRLQRDMRYVPDVTSFFISELIAMLAAYPVAKAVGDYSAVLLVTCIQVSVWTVLTHVLGERFQVTRVEVERRDRIEPVGCGDRLRDARFGICQLHPVAAAFGQQAGDKGTDLAGAEDEDLFHGIFPKQDRRRRAGRRWRALCQCRRNLSIRKLCSFAMQHGIVARSNRKRR